MYSNQSEFVMDDVITAYFWYRRVWNRNPVSAWRCAMLWPIKNISTK